MSSPYGYSITARKSGSPGPGVFISGQSFEAGRCRLIVPLRAGDFVPVWRTEAEAAGVVDLFGGAATEHLEFAVVEAGNTARAPGPAKRLRGMGGFVIPAPRTPFCPGGMGDAEWMPWRPDR